jgi:hypothetical protein
VASQKSLPKKHLATLKRLLENHRQEVAELRAAYRDLAAEIERRKAGEWRDPNPKPQGIPGLVNHLELVGRQLKAHEELIRFGEDDRLHVALGELAENRDVALEAARDPRAFARSRGVALPPYLDLQVLVRQKTVEVRATNLDELAPTVIVWNEDGFSTPWRLSR